MRSEICIPPMGESLSEVAIGSFLSPEGTIVRVDDELVELETDKVNQVLYASVAGRVKWHVKQGDTVAIGAVIGYIESHENSSFINETSEKEKSADFIDKKDLIENKIEEKNKSDASVRHFTKSDLLVAIKEGKKEKETAVSLSSSSKNEAVCRDELRQEIRRPMSSIRKVIAKRLVEAKQSTAMLTTFNEVDLTEVIALREKYRDEFMEKYHIKLGFMSFFVKATTLALSAFPSVNSYINGEDIVERTTCDIGVAVGTDKGVIVPVLRRCESLSFADIEQKIDGFATKAREGQLIIEDLQGGGFTITNGGIYGSLLSTPILIPPQCAILGMHKIQKRAMVINDEIKIRSMMYLALSYDHRLLDGKEAVSFLKFIKEHLEDTSRFVLGI